MSYPPYTSYSPCRFPEAGEIPENWEVRRLKFAVTLRNEKIDAEEADLEYMGLEHIESWTGKRIEDATASSEGIATRFLRNDVLFGKLRPYLAKVYLADNPGMATSEALVLVSEKVLKPAFLKYLLLSEKFIDTVSGTTYGAKMPRANWDSIGGLPILLPSADEQKQIAEFLDWKTGQIGALIAKKKQFIEKLQEKRIAFITHAVTQGLNPQAPMRDSGIPSLGEVPEHWEVKRLKFHIKALASGVSVNAEQVPVEGNEPGILKTSSVYGNRFRPYENKRVLSEEIDRLACPVIKDSIIISRMNTPDLVGHCGYVEEDHLNLFLPDRLWITRFTWDFSGTVKFFWYFLSSKCAQGITESLATGASGSMKNITHKDYLCIRVPTPSKIEQAKIVKEIDNQCDGIELLIDKALIAIDRLTEYRTALITAATTGKIDVRNIKLGATV